MTNSFHVRHLVAEHGLQWPAGHRRFFYVRDSTEGVYRLQTFRYESAEISEIVPEGVDIHKAEAEALRGSRDIEEDQEGSSAEDEDFDAEDEDPCQAEATEDDTEDASDKE